MTYAGPPARSDSAKAVLAEHAKIAFGKHCFDAAAFDIDGLRAEHFASVHGPCHSSWQTKLYDGDVGLVADARWGISTIRGRHVIVHGVSANHGDAVRAMLVQAWACSVAPAMKARVIEFEETARAMYAAHLLGLDAAAHGRFALINALRIWAAEFGNEWATQRITDEWRKKPVWEVAARLTHSPSGDLWARFLGSKRAVDLDLYADIVHVSPGFSVMAATLGRACHDAAHKRADAEFSCAPFRLAATADHKLLYAGLVEEWS